MIFFFFFFFCVCDHYEKNNFLADCHSRLKHLQMVEISYVLISGRLYGILARSIYRKVSSVHCR